MIRIFSAILTYLNKKIMKLSDNEKRLNDLEKDVELIKAQDEGRLSFTRGLFGIQADVVIIKNEIEHLAEFRHEIIDRINRLEERMERRRIVQPVDFDRRQK
jgi:hypothetical protein